MNEILMKFPEEKLPCDAIDFELLESEGEKIKLSSFKGKKIVLYFYPKDNTPGCTKEACSLRDYNEEILKTGAVILGVSPDSPKTHKKFREKYSLPFYLLSDEEHIVANLYGAWGEKKMYGKSYMGIIRSTFIIDENFKIIKVFEKVSVDKHGEEILEYLKKIT